MTAIESEKKRLSFWVVVGGVIATLLLVGGIGGTLIKRLQATKTTETAIALVAADTKAAAETATTRPTASPTGSVILSAAPTSTSMVTKTPTQTSTLEIGTIKVSEKDGMVQVFVSAEEFQMGSTREDPDAEYDEWPLHVVFLDSFWIDQTEVTSTNISEAGAHTI